MYLKNEQIERLLAPIKPSRVVKLDNLSHVEAYDVRAHLNRIFGFANWSADVIDMVLVSEQFGKNKRGGEAVTVVYRAGLRLTVKSPSGEVLATYTEYAAGDAINFPIFKLGDAHDFAIKTAESQALKRAATNLGDQFGLSLYNNGSVNPLVQVTLVGVEEPDPEFETPEVAPETTPEAAVEQPADTSDEARDWITLIDATDDVDGLRGLYKEVTAASLPEVEEKTLKDLIQGKAKQLQDAAV